MKSFQLFFTGLLLVLLSSSCGKEDFALQQIDERFELGFGKSASLDQEDLTIQFSFHFLQLKCIFACFFPLPYLAVERTGHILIYRTDLAGKHSSVLYPIYQRPGQFFSIPNQ